MIASRPACYHSSSSRLRARIVKDRWKWDWPKKIRLTLPPRRRKMPLSFALFRLIGTISIAHFERDLGGSASDRRGAVRQRSATATNRIFSPPVNGDGKAV